MINCEKTDCIHFRDGECHKEMVEISEDGCVSYHPARRIKHDEVDND